MKTQAKPASEKQMTQSLASELNELVIEAARKIAESRGMLVNVSARRYDPSSGTCRATIELAIPQSQPQYGCKFAAGQRVRVISNKREYTVTGYSRGGKVMMTDAVGRVFKIREAGLEVI